MGIHQSIFQSIPQRGQETLIEFWVVLIGFEVLVSWLMDVVFFFLPDLLQMFALSILVLDISKILDAHGKDNWKKFVQILYGLYMLLYIVPFDWESLTATLTLEDLAYKIGLMFPYICLLLFPVMLKKYTWIGKVINYWTLHAYFIAATIITAKFTPDSWGSVANVYIAFVYIILSLIFSLYGGALANEGKQQR